MSGLIEQPRSLCALGAQQTASAIERTVPIIHTGPGCGFKLHLGLGFYNGFQGGGCYGGASIVSSNLTDRDIVFGGEQRLQSVIDGALKVMDADLYVVLSGCSSELIGDDTAAVVASFRQRGIPIVYASTGGLRGNNYLGHEALCLAIVEGLLEPAQERIPNLVNVWASVPYQDTLWAGNLSVLKNLLAGLGLKPNVLFGPASGGLTAWKQVPAAEFNLVVSPWVGVTIAESLEKRFGTPWFHFPSLPIGGIETSRFLREVAAFAKLDSGQSEAFIRQCEAEYYYYLERLADFILEFRWDMPSRFTSVTDAYYATGLARFLTNDLGLIPAQQFVTEDPPERFRSGIHRAFQDIAPGISANVTFESDGGVIHQALRGQSGPPSILLGTSWDRQIARELGACHLSVGSPMTDRLVCNAAYAGYIGGLRLLEDLYSSILTSVQ
jgi:nitrogenase molybdenum-iron protein beta chain